MSSPLRGVGLTLRAVHTLQLLLIGLGLGLGAAVPIGPVNVEIARRTLARGKIAGLSLGFGAVTVDVIFAVAVSLGLANVIDRSELDGPFGYVGVAICFVLAGFSLYAARRAYVHGVPEPGPADNTPRTMAADYATGFGMTALNLYTWVWWLAVPTLVPQQAEGTARDLPITCLGVAVAASAWVIGFTTMISKLRRFAGRAWHVGADLGGGLLLTGFGFWALWRLL